MSEDRTSLVDLLADRASFRDPSARVLLRGEKVYRVFTPEGAQDFFQLMKSGLLEEWSARKQIVESYVRTPSDISSVSPQAALVLEHPKIPFLSYPYEWSFGMLRAAALLELDLLRDSMERGFILKDATPYNVQFVGRRPLHIDPPSFIPWKEGGSWEAYSQFCRLFLNPLLLTSLTGMRFQPLLRGSLEGIPSSDIAGVLPWYQKLRPAVFTHVMLQNWLQNSFADISVELAQTAKTTSTPRKRVIRLVEQLRTLIAGLKPPGLRSGWARYEQQNSYKDEAREFKEGFVHQALSKIEPRFVWDIGCNTGQYSLIAARSASYVLAFDQDPAVIDILQQRLNREQCDNVLALVNNALDPSPSRGWNGEERPGLVERGNPDSFLCLALIHHLAISGNLPLPKIVDWLSNLAPTGIIEFVPKEDTMVQRLLQWRTDIFSDYTVEAFESALKNRFRVLERKAVPGSKRMIYAVSK